MHSLQRRFSGRNDLALDAAGRIQVSALAARVDRAGPTTIVCSPLRRARETADAIALTSGLSVHIDPGLAELDFGDWEGLSADEARERDRLLFDAWTADPDRPTPGGESFTALERRVVEARDRILATFPGQVVVLVSHVSPIKALVRIALAAPPSAVLRMHLDTASLSIIDYVGTETTASLRLFNDTAHLDTARP